MRYINRPCTAQLITCGLLILSLTSCSGTSPGDEGSTPAAGKSDPAVVILNASPEAIAADPGLSQYVQTTATAVIPGNCSTCHGEELKGAPGVPDLTDYNWLWGSAVDYSAVGAVLSIQRTLTYGIRNRDCPEEQQSYGACSDTRFSQMPGYGTLEMYNEQQVRDLTEYVLDLAGLPADAAAVERAGENWAVCVECHGEYGEGYPDYGGPNLGDEVSLYGNDRDTIYDVIYSGREGACPVWGQTFDAATIMALAVYLYRLSNPG